MARKVKFYAVLKGTNETIYFERGSQAHNNHLTVGHEAFKGEWFSSAFVAAKALSDYLETGKK